jgi:SAM-dependent methyltransferase
MAALEILLTGLRAAAEPTRLRVLALLAEGELTVKEITDILGQSQPRVSRHLKLLAEGGLVERFKEGTWAFFRLAESGRAAGLASAILTQIDSQDPALSRDRERLDTVRRRRAEAASAYFRAHALEWNRLRSLHVDEAEVEAAMLMALGPGRIDSLLDLGTGTGRILELFASRLGRGLGLDVSHDMLTVARATLDRGGLRHVQVRHGDVYNLFLEPGSFDAVVVHQVLHYLDDPARALREAARVLAPGGRLLVVDFAPHNLEFLRDEHAHRRLGFGEDEVRQWLEAAALGSVAHRDLPPAQGGSGKLTVSIWLAQKAAEPSMRLRPREKAA